MRRTFLEYLIDSCSETLIVEMAVSRKEAKSKVVSYSKQIVLHLVKLQVLDSPTTHNHWYSELDTFLYNYEDLRLKGANKLVSGDQLYQWFFNDGYDLSTNMIDKNIKRMVNGDYNGTKLLEYDTQTV